MSTPEVRAAAENYCAEHNLGACFPGYSDRPGGKYWEPNEHHVDTFLAGDANGVKRTLEQAAEGFDEWCAKRIGSPTSKLEFAEWAWEARGLLAAKELQEKDAEIERLRKGHEILNQAHGSLADQIEKMQFRIEVLKSKADSLEIQRDLKIKQLQERDARIRKLEAELADLWREAHAGVFDREYPLARELAEREKGEA